MLESKPFLISTTISAVIQAIFQIAWSLAALFIYHRLVDTFFQTDYGGGGSPESLVLSFQLPLVLVSIYVASFFGLCLAPLLHGGIGLLYAYLYQREGYLRLGTNAGGGALSAGLGQLIGGIMGLLGNVVFIWLSTREAYNNLTYHYSDYSSEAEILRTIMLYGLLGNLPGYCFGILIAAILGGLGGLLGGNIFHSRRSK